jgi:hypothetical protein
MTISDTKNNLKAKVDAFERGLKMKQELENKNLDIDIAILQVVRELNLPFAYWLVENAERQQKAPREILNNVLTLAMQTNQ